MNFNDALNHSRFEHSNASGGAQSRDKAAKDCTYSGGVDAADY